MGHLATDSAQAPQDDPEAGSKARADDRQARGRVPPRPPAL